MSINKKETAQPCSKSSRHKLAILTFVGLLAPVYFIPPALSAVLDAPRLVNVGAAVGGIVVLMTYVIMPVLAQLTAVWLCESTKQTKEQTHD